MFLKLMVLSLVIFLSACSPDSPSTSPAAEKTASANAHKKIEYHNDYQIGVYTSSAWGFSTNSYWIEGPDGVVLIGAQFLPSAANEAVDIAQSVTGKKVVLAIVLHANPDEFNGTATLKARGIKVVSSKQVVALIAQVDKKRREWFYDRYKPDYPEKLVLPDVMWDKTQEFDAAGLHFKAYVIRDAVSNAHVLISLDGHLFVGDLIANKYHAWLELAKSNQWLERLEEIRRFAQAKVIHPGRGYAMASETLLTQQEDYLKFINKTLADFYTGGKITEQDKKSVIDAIVKQYPDYGFAVFLKIGIPAEWEQKRAKDHEKIM